MRSVWKLYLPSQKSLWCLCGSVWEFVGFPWCHCSCSEWAALLDYLSNHVQYSPVKISVFKSVSHLMKNQKSFIISSGQFWYCCWWKMGMFTDNCRNIHFHSQPQQIQQPLPGISKIYSTCRQAGIGKWQVVFFTRMPVNDICKGKSKPVPDIHCNYNRQLPTTIFLRSDQALTWTKPVNTVDSSACQNEQESNSVAGIQSCHSFSIPSI